MQDTFEELQDHAIEMNVNLSEERQIEVAECQAEFDRLVDEAQMLFLAATRNNETSVLNNSSGLGSSPFRLPKLQLVKFDGSLGNWRTWYNLFKVSVHSNPALTAVEKFQYLIGSLKDEALALITGLDITEGNYTVAWQLLCQRFHSERRHIFFHYNGFLDLPELKQLDQISSFITKIREHSQALSALGHPPEHYDGLLTALVVRRFSPRFRQRLEDYRGAETNFPKMKEILAFLEKECRSAEDCPTAKKDQKSLITCPETTPSSTSSKNPKGKKQVASKSESKGTTGSLQCPCCHKSHRLGSCNVFRNQSLEEKRRTVSKGSRCYGCLGPHQIADCSSTGSCSRCGSRKHNSLLHPEEANPSGHASADNVKSMTATPPKPTPALIGTMSSTVLLATVQLRIKAGRSSQVVRGILDSASMGTLITKECASKLGLRLVPTSNVSGVSGSVVQSHGQAHVTLSSINHKTFAKDHPVTVVDSITAPTPSVAISSQIRQKILGWNLADPTFDVCSPIDILIGVDLFARLIVGPPITLGPDLPTAFQTLLGCVLMGSAPSQEPPITSMLACLHVSPFESAPSSDQFFDFQRFYELEDIKPSKSIQAPDDPAEIHYRATTKRLDSGRYQVSLPFKAPPETLGDSRTQAERRFYALERRFRTQPEFKKRYVDYMNGYLDSGFMAPAPKEATHGPHYFLPHHGVIKETSNNHKLRVVMDASAKTTSGKSLNDILHNGPSLISHIRDLLLKFRRHKIVFSCDIKQMYLQISMDPTHRRYHLVLWRPDENSPLRIYQMTTVTFGVGPSSFLAIRTLIQLALDHRVEFPLAANIILEESYADDLASGDRDIPRALTKRQQLIELLKKGNFPLAKWFSNDPALLEGIPPEQLETPVSLSDFLEYAFSILGLQWLPKEDVFTFKVQNIVRPCTKRGVSSIIASLFDPCGWVGPTVFWAKVFLQQLWLLKLDWDTPLPEPHQKKWAHFLETLPALQSIRLPRVMTDPDEPIQLHGFADASELGYGTVVYMRSDKPPHTTHLLMAKSRLAPLKKISIPRLELCGNALMAILLNHLMSQLSPHYQISSLHAWTDSTTALTWIQTPSYRLKTFVANRVAFIQESVPNANWHHVESKDNPADCLSRGIYAHQLISHDLWFKGPNWLSDDPERWRCLPLPPATADIPESRSPAICLLSRHPPPQFTIFERISDWNRLTNALAYVHRFIANCRKPKTDRHTGPLTPEEREIAEYLIIKKIQADAFSKEILQISQGHEAPPNLGHLSPFLDARGLLRVGGRLDNSQLDTGKKHPMVLPKNHSLVSTLIRSSHLRNLHAGPQLLQNLLAQRFWIMQGRVAIRSVIRRCVPCFRCRPRNNEPKMASLPEPRVKPSRPFLHTGCDFAGPFYVRASLLRNAKTLKAYLCVFICMATKAVHLEVTEDLSADTFCAALSRFASRRGIPSDFYSDCGGAFRKANTDLRQAVRSLNEALQTQPQPTGLGEVEGMRFHFNPAHAPHMGGLWEAAVKAAKHHLVRVMQGKSLTVEEFRTLVTKVEAMLNSRPLTPISSDPSEILPLTPGHFLIGDSLRAVPEIQHEGPRTPLKRWHRVQAMSQDIWRRWHTEYLHTLSPRKKWTKGTPPLKVNDLVIIDDPNYHSLCWHLGRITKLHPGKDGHVRAATVRTKTAELRRPAVKLFPLPIEDTEEE
ncbi:uncharacterized protein [Bemisia tabaci]|uniref:uncharacterized protein n=1 Tax=Bemisia tabaci TaxID=7038 RepID=UPI003B27EA5A